MRKNKFGRTISMTFGNSLDSIKWPQAISLKMCQVDSSSWKSVKNTKTHVHDRNKQQCKEHTRVTVIMSQCLRKFPHGHQMIWVTGRPLVGFTVSFLKEWDRIKECVRRDSDESLGAVLLDLERKAPQGSHTVNLSSCPERRKAMRDTWDNIEVSHMAGRKAREQRGNNVPEKACLGLGQHPKRRNWQSWLRKMGGPSWTSAMAQLMGIRARGS